MTDEIEKASRRRRILLGTYGLVFLAFQELYFSRLDAPFAAWQPIEYVWATLYVAWSATLIYVLASGGLPFRRRSPEARRALNDELTEANRRFAYRAGYWMLLGSIAVIYALSRFTDWTVGEAMRLLFAFGVAMPAIAFAGKERRQGA